MKKYLKPASKLIDLESKGCYLGDPAIEQSQYGSNETPTKGTDNWEPEQDVDSGFDW